MDPKLGLLFSNLKPSGKDSADPIHHESQHHITIIIIFMLYIIGKLITNMCFKELRALTRHYNPAAEMSEIVVKDSPCWSRIVSNKV